MVRFGLLVTSFSALMISLCFLSSLCPSSAGSLKDLIIPFIGLEFLCWVPLGDGYLNLMLLLVFDAFFVVRLEHLVAGDWECVSRFLAISFRGRGSSNLLDMELIFC